MRHVLPLALTHWAVISLEARSRYQIALAELCLLPVADEKVSLPGVAGDPGLAEDSERECQKVVYWILAVLLTLLADASKVIIAEDCACEIGRPEGKGHVTYFEEPTPMSLLVEKSPTTPPKNLTAGFFKSMY